MAAAVVVGTVIGSGVFKKAKNVAENVPDFGPAMGVWMLGGVLALFGALALAEVAVLFPKAGGNYVFLREAYGRMWGFLWGWVEFGIIRSASIAALATMFAESLNDVLGKRLDADDRLGVTVGSIVFLSLVNIRGTRLGGGVQVFLTALKIGSLIGIALLPFLVLAFVPVPEFPPSTANMTPLLPKGDMPFEWSKFGAALVAVLWAYHGWMNIGPIAEEVTNPQRNIPRALLGGVCVLILLYVSANVAYYSVMTRDEMMAVKDTTVATVYCARLLGSAGVAIASAIVMCSVLGSLNGNVLVGPRLLFAMGADRLAPQALTKLHPRYATPARATAVYSGWACLQVIVLGMLAKVTLPPVSVGSLSLDVNVPAGSSAFDLLTDFAMFGAVAMETLAVAAVMVFRVKKPDADRPYRCWGYPVVPVVYCCVMALVLANMFATPAQRAVAVPGAIFIAAGVVLYQVKLKR